MSNSNKYVPSGSSVQSVVNSLSDYISGELALPGNWSPTLFYEDLKNYPSKSKRDLANYMVIANQEKMSYLEYFDKTRGYPRNYTSSDHKEVWDIFNNGMVMLYFEKVFLDIISKHKITQEDKIILLYIRNMSKTHSSNWNEIVKSIGACCYQFFSKDPYLYIPLLKRDISNTNNLTLLTDMELFNKLDSKLSPIKYRNKISVNDSRTKLIDAVKRKQEMSM